MASPLKGKIFMLLLFFSVCSFSDFVSCSSTPLTEDPQVPAECKPQSDNEVSNLLHCHQQAQIDKLEQLVKNLTELVAKLGSNQYGIPRIGEVSGNLGFDGGDAKVDRSRERREVVTSEVRLKKTVASVTKHSAFSSEQFWFLSAVNLDSEVVSLSVLPFRDHEGHSKYVAIGDDRGRVYVLLRNGVVLVEFYTLSGSPVTAMTSCMSVYKNESVVVTGHSSGAVLVHRIWESSTGDEWSKLQMENVVALDAVGFGEIGSPVSILEVHYVGRSRYILSADTKGRIKAFRENGELRGVAVPSSRPLAFLKQRLLFLTETGAGSLDLRTMKVKEVECEGLNRSFVKQYAFDSTEQLKAYGVTSNGDLVHALLLGDSTNFKCRVRSWKNIGLDESLAIQVIKGYLLIADQEKLHVYNISSQHYSRSGAPRLVFSAGIDEIRSSFGANKAMSKDLQTEKRVPLIASDREKLVVLGFGGGCVGLYRSNLPVTKAESSSMFWTSPVLLFVLFLFGLWHFFAKKKESLTLWGSDDPFTSTSVTKATPLGGSGSGDRSFTDLSSRNSNSADLRSNNGFSGASRRYGSPTRYPVGGSNSFRPNSVDTSSRPSVDPNFRAAPELKFRGSNVESSGFPKRRENMYVNSQVLDETN